MDARTLIRNIQGGLIAAYPPSPGRARAYAVHSPLGTMSLRRDGSVDWNEPDPDATALYADTDGNPQHDPTELMHWVDVFERRSPDGALLQLVVRRRSLTVHVHGHRLTSAERKHLLVLEPGRRPRFRPRWIPGRGPMMALPAHRVNEALREIAGDDDAAWSRLGTLLGEWYPGLEYVWTARPPHQGADPVTDDLSQHLHRPQGSITGWPRQYPSPQRRAVTAALMTLGWGVPGFPAGDTYAYRGEAGKTRALNDLRYMRRWNVTHGAMDHLGALILVDEPLFSRRRTALVPGPASHVGGVAFIGCTVAAPTPAPTPQPPRVETAVDGPDLPF